MRCAMNKDDEVKLRLFDVHDGENSILITDGEEGIFANREDVLRRSSLERLKATWVIMGAAGARRPLGWLEEHERPRSEWTELDYEGSKV